MLKIVAGKYRSRMIEVPPNVTVPTKSMTRTAVGNALGMIIPGSVVLDLFAGSGALGIEALSRGASLGYFVDLDKKAVDVIRNNLSLLKETHGRAYNMSASEALSFFEENGIRFDIIFIDPPYAKKELYSESLQTIVGKGASEGRRGHHH